MDLCVSGGWSGISPIPEAFSILAVGTSLIGTLLEFSQFFLEQLSNIDLGFFLSTSTMNRLWQEKFGGQVVDEDLNVTNDVSKEWWKNNKLKFTAAVMAVAPTLLVSTTIPDAFSLATDVTGGYCMTILYGVLPPAIAWAMQAQLSFDDKSNNNNNKVDDESEVESGMVISDVKPALIGVGVFVGSLVIEQVLLDLVSILHL
ncbi:hypothetical protein QJS04_geneDACA002440 [Acorus gramineus]|uniref:Uncharacterized protein n=1 Tax=Acorus gramineus TaxID=55184 RepID=A0AAV9A8H2_ACOGR|nr:hypothetical protein QJS04_geneDACA002440 [Acorus gramineus]